MIWPSSWVAANDSVKQLLTVSIDRWHLKHSSPYNNTHANDTLYLPLYFERSPSKMIPSEFYQQSLLDDDERIDSILADFEELPLSMAELEDFGLSRDKADSKSLTTHFNCRIWQR